MFIEGVSSVVSALSCSVRFHHKRDVMPEGFAFCSFSVTQQAALFVLVTSQESW